MLSIVITRKTILKELDFNLIDFNHLDFFVHTSAYQPLQVMLLLKDASKSPLVLSLF
jgi:hypothetical protein